MRITGWTWILTGVISIGISIGPASSGDSQEPSIDDLMANDVSEAQMNEPLPAPLPVVRTDWFAEFEKLYIDRLTPPEENGMGDVLAALGPAGLEQNGLARSVPWEEFPTDERSRQWYHGSWTPICERLGIDPAARPAWLGYRGLDEYLKIYGFTGDEPAMEEEADGWQPVSPDVRHSEMPKPKMAWERATRRAERLRSVPWTAKDCPMAARWVTETSPLLDLWGNAIRKPQFVGYSLPASSMMAVLLPEVQSQREFARGIMTRICFAVGTAEPGSPEIDAAIHDVQTLMLFNRKHFQHSTFLVTRLVGIAVESMGQNAALTMLRSGKMSDAQRERLAAILAELPPVESLDRCMESEQIMTLQAADQLLFDDPKEFSDDDMWLYDEFRFNAFPRKMFRAMRFDQALIHRKIREAYAEAASIANEPDRAVFQERLRQRDEQLRKVSGAGSDAQVLRLLGAMTSVQKRSEAMTDITLALLLPATGAVRDAIDRSECSRRLLETGVALERYQRSHGAYPESLDALVTAGLLTAVPVDPYTGGPFTYCTEPFTPPMPDPEGFAEWKAEMEDEADGPDRIAAEMMPGYTIYANLRSSPYLLYSIGRNGIDDTTRWLLPENRVSGRAPTDWIREGRSVYSSRNTNDDLRL